MRMERLARTAAQLAGSTPATLGAFAFVAAWGVIGFVRRDGFDDTYQLWLNTPTTAITFLIVFVIQRAQNADTRALHLKLDELVRAVDGARDEVAEIEKDADAMQEAR